MNFLNRWKIWKIAFALCATWLLLLGLGLPARAQTPVPLERNGSLYVVQQPGANSVLNKLDRSTTVYTLKPVPVTGITPTGSLNALGYNPKDGYMYLLTDPVTGAGKGLYRVGKTGVNVIGYEYLGLVANLPAGSYFAADVSKDGYMYVSSSGLNATNTLYSINLNGSPGAGNYGATPVTMTVTSTSPGTTATTLSTGDLAFAANGTLYALSLNGSLLYAINVSPGATTATASQRTTTRSGVSASAQIGTLFYDGIQGPFAYDNAGGFYIVDTANATVSSSSTATAVTRSDGTGVNDTPEYIDVVKSVGTLNQVNARTFDVPFTIGVKNTSAATAQNVQAVDNLRLTFTSGNPDISISSNPRISVLTAQSNRAATLNQNFNGTSDVRLFAGTDNYAPGDTVFVTFTARLTYPTTAAVPTTLQRNFAYVSSVPGSTFVNNGHTFSPDGIAIRPNGAVASEASSPGTSFPTRKAGDDPDGTGVNLPPIALEGRVYEDVNFGGGAGRAFNAGQGMAGAPNARVEIYDNTGKFVGFTQTVADGTWSYAVATTGTYYARVVNSSVLSTRTGSVATLIGVQTFRTNDGAAIPTEVGGRAPASPDAGAGNATTTLNTSTFQLSGGATGQAQSVSPIVVNGTAGRAGFDFGFNFDTIVNTNDAGQGSLRQFVLNSNALSNTNLAQQGLTAGVETTIFQIPAAALTSGVGKITLASGLVITGANAASTAIDGTTQTRNIGDTNAGTYGVGGVVGTQNVALPTLQRPEIEIYGPRTIAVGLDLNADSALVKGVSIWGFGDSGNVNTRASIRVGTGSGSNFIGPIIREVLVGTSAIPSNGGLLAPATGSYGSGDLISGNGVKNGQILNSIISYGGGKGVALNAGADGWTITGNEIGNDSRDSNQWDGIDAQVARTNITANLVYLSGGSGIDSFSSSGSAIVRNNTVRNNGQLCTPTTGEPAGIRSYGTGNTIEFNIVFHNYGAGVLVQATGSALISRNSIYGNGQFAPVTAPGVAPSLQIGIDLLKASDAVDHGTQPYVTPNDAGDPDVGANGLLNFPVITGYEINNGQLTLEGFAPPGATVELFAADPDASGFGQGKTYQFFFVEGSATDLDNTTGAYDATTLQTFGYSATVANKAGSETAANRFRIVVPANGLAPNTPIATTATVNNLTSEFSLATGTIPINRSVPTVNGTVYLDANRNGTLDNQESGTGISGLFVKAFLGSATTAAQVVPVDAATGTFSFSNLAAGNYTLVLDDNNVATDKTPATSANSALLTNYVGTQSPDGTRQLTVGAQTVLSQDFGLLRGAQISGTVFEDQGAGTGPGLAGVKVELRKASDNSVVDSTSTDGNGNFTFRVPDNLAGTPLRVVETNPAGTQSASGNAGNTNGTYTLATDTIEFNYAAGSTYSGLRFGDARGVTFENEDAKIGPAGSSLVYTHVFTAQTAGSVSFNTTQAPSPANPNWSVATYRDSNNNGVLDGADAIITAPVPVVAGVPITVFVKNFIPTTAANGAQDRLTITATFTPTGAPNNGPVQTLSRTDLTTVASNTGLSLTKTVDKATARSNDVLLYTITYRNTGAEALTNLIIRDATPAYTTFVSAANGALAPGLSAPTIAAPGVAAKGAVTWTFGGSLNPGQSGTVTFSAKVQ